MARGRVKRSALERAGKQRQSKAQECQMEIGLHGPRGRRHVINAGWEALKERLCSQGNTQKQRAGGPPFFWLLQS